MDLEKYSAAYEEFSDAIYRYCYFRVFDKDKAQELMQEVFMKTWKYICEGNEVENMKAFLYRSAHNLIVNEARKKRELSLDRLQMDGFDVANTDDRKMQSLAEFSVLNGVLDTLDSDTRELITMRYLDDLKPEEIAKIKKINANLISVRIHRAIKKIKKLTKDNE